MSFQHSLVLVSLLVASASALHTPYALRDVHRGLFHRRLNTPSPLVSRDVALDNAIAAQSLNAQFATLDANTACTDGQVACIGNDFAECWQGKFVTTQCVSGLQCYALPSVNEAGTTVTCDTPEDALARFAAAGSTGGITGSGSTVVASTNSETASSSASAQKESTSAAQTTASEAATTKAVNSPPATIRGGIATSDAKTSEETSTATETPTSTEKSEPTSTQSSEPSSTHSSAPSSTHSSAPSSTHSSAPAQQTPSSTLGLTSSIPFVEAILSATTENPNSGDATFYETGLTACGVTNSDTDYIVAVSEQLFDNFPGATANPNDNPICGKKVQISFEGRSATATVTDRCTACQPQDLDMTPTLFQNVIGPLSIGRASGMKWVFTA